MIGALNDADAEHVDKYGDLIGRLCQIEKEVFDTDDNRLYRAALQTSMDAIVTLMRDPDGVALAEKTVNALEGTVYVTTARSLELRPPSKITVQRKRARQAKYA